MYLVVTKDHLSDLERRAARNTRRMAVVTGAASASSAVPAPGRRRHVLARPRSLGVSLALGATLVLGALALHGPIT